MPASRRNIAALLLVISVWMCSCSRQAESDRGKNDYRIIHKVIVQPIDHANPAGAKLEQRVDILIPEGAPQNSPVFFNLGNETDQTDEDLTKLYDLHGRRRDIIYIQAEHRGYGQSLTQDEDQSVPSYVQIDRTLDDAHEAIRQLKKEYPGPWMAAGWSYGGGLVINFAARYPDDVKVILSSSGVVDWPFMNYSYEHQVRKTMGDGCYKRLANHIENLKPAQPFDQTWHEREFLHAIIVGMTQFENFRKLRPYFKLMSYLPTKAFLRALHWTDAKYSGGGAWKYAEGWGDRKLTHQEAETGDYNWRVWHYQQCMQVGVFLASESTGGLFPQTKQELCDECETLFGEKPSYANGPEWSPRKMLETLTVPIIYVSGGNDPWFAVGLKPDYKVKAGKVFYLREGYHCPDRDDPALAREALAEMLKYAGAKSE